MRLGTFLIRPEGFPAESTFLQHRIEKRLNVSGQVLIHRDGQRFDLAVRAVVRDVNVEVAQGEVVGLLGPNGAGKTTTFYMIVGLTRPDVGSVMLGSHNITNLPMYLRAQNGIGYLPQEASVFRKLTVEANIMAILETLPISGRERRKRLDSLLEEFGITHVRKSIADTISGGERRRVEIARSLVISPKFIRLDDTFSGIDQITVIEIQKIISHLKSKDIGVLIKYHNVR